MIHKLRMRWWRLRTRLRLLHPAERLLWQTAFHTQSELTAARHWADQGMTVGFQTLAGFYNDHVPGGFMTVEQAEKLYAEGKR